MTMPHIRTGQESKKHKKLDFTLPGPLFSNKHEVINKKE